MLNFLVIYEEKSNKYHEELFELQKQIDDIDKEMVVLRENLNKLQPQQPRIKHQRYLYFWPAS
jgi:hypothetical protein